jgi:Ca2+-binding EF-hand superfamily protein
MDKDRSGHLNLEEMNRAMHDYRISTNPKEIQAIFDIFDIDHSGHLTYNEFLRVIVGEMNDFRREIC